MNRFKTTFLTSLGAGLEYYDFVIYGMMIPYLSQLFYPQADSSVSLLNMFGIFAVGYISRPIGGVFFAMYGDRFGRRTTLLIVMSIMAIATACMGLLPTYENFGVAATVMLVILRLLQGFSYGAELPGAITIIAESSDEKRKGLHCGFVMSSTAIGATLGSLVLYVLSSVLEKQEILQWGWRIPFLIGMLLAAISFYMRFNVAESAQFLAQSNPNKNLMAPLKDLLLRYRAQLIIGTVLTLFSATLVIMNIYFTSYFTTYYSFEPKQLYISTIWSRIWCALSLVLFGAYADRIGSKNLLFATSIAFIAASMAYMFFDPLQHGSFAMLLVLHFIYETFVAAYVAGYFPVMADLFATKVRFTGIAICYNVAYLLASSVPSVLTATVAYVDAPVTIMMLPIFLALLAALAVQSARFNPAKYIPLTEF